MSGVQEWWGSIPLVTKYLLAASFAITLAGNFRLVNPFLLMLDIHAVWRSFQVWRLVTCFFFFSLGFPFLIQMMFLYQYASSLEKNHFEGKIPDFVFMLTFAATLLLIVGSVMGMPVLGASLIMVIIYFWSRKNPNVTMSFMFGIKFQSIYFPWFLCALTVLLGGSPVGELIGIVIGHLYLFLVEIYPATGGPRLLETPNWFINLFPLEYCGGYKNVKREVRHQWGAGRVLGE